MDRARLIADLKRDEGLRLVAYRDSVGVLTIGFGHTGPDVTSGLKWSVPDAEDALNRDVDTVFQRLSLFSWFQGLDGVRQMAFCNMAFNIGAGGVNNFHRAMAAIANRDYETAANELLNSKWAAQVGSRAKRIAQMVRTGEAA